jgi:hypothetical protein
MKLSEEHIKTLKQALKPCPENPQGREKAGNDEKKAARKFTAFSWTMRNRRMARKLFASGTAKVRNGNRRFLLRGFKP